MATASCIVCPRCSFEQDDGAACARCGVVFDKLQADRTEHRPALMLEISPSEAEVARMDRTAWTMLAAGLVAALAAHALPPTRFMLRPLVTLLHEFGHAVAAWLLGCPAIPAFDFVYGGGVTHHKLFQLPLGVLIGLGWVWLGWTFRRNPRTLALVAFCGALWLVAISSEWRREVVISAMGHGGELILAGVLLWMALSGRGWRMPEIERPLGAFAAFFVQIQTMQFAWRLRSDPAYLDWYREGKGGAMMNDLEVIALDLKIWTGMPLDIETVAGWLLVAGPVTMIAAVLLFVYRRPVGRVASSLLLLAPSATAGTCRRP